MTDPVGNFFIRHLGKPLQDVDPEIFKLARKPSFEMPEHSPIGDIFFKKLSFAIAFCPPDFYHCDDKLAGFPAILTNVQLYFDETIYGVKHYEHPLPHGISATDNRAGMLAKLGQPKWTFPFVAPFKYDRWDFADHWVLAVYHDDLTRVQMFEIGLQPNAPTQSVMPPMLQPDIHTLQRLFEKPWRTVMTENCLKAADFSELQSSVSGDTAFYELNEKRTLGLEVYFRPSLKANEPFHILSGARYFRKGLFFSCGFDGELPKGLKFSDRPEDVIRKVGSYPVTGSADGLSGYFVWSLPEYMLHVGFSVLEQRVNRIRVAAHPYFSPELLESPLLQAPS